MKMTKIVRTTADLFFPFCLVFGLYVVIHGHLTPGGGFQGGAVMATGTALLLVARAYDDVTGRIRKGAMKVCEAAGLLIFLCAGLSGLFAGRPFMANWLAPAGTLFRTSVAHGLVVVARDGQHFFGRRCQQKFIGRGDFVGADGTRLRRNRCRAGSR